MLADLLKAQKTFPKKRPFYTKTPPPPQNALNTYFSIKKHTYLLL